jgi:glycosyltransferase involved in cell wall biosynthesis
MWTPDKLSIFHVNVGGDRIAVDGMPIGCRRRVEAQRSCGHCAEIFDFKEFPDRSDFEIARIVARRLRGHDRPDVIHFYSVFRPLHVGLGRLAERRGVPYVVMPASGLSAGSLARNGIKKRLFITMADAPFMRASRAVLCKTNQEVLEVRDAVRAHVPTCVVPTDAPLSEYPLPIWAPVGGRQRLVSLGRFDVWQKGLDLLAEIARQLPEVDVVVYGQPDHNSPESVRALVANAPDNFALAEPVFGVAKDEILAGATMYIQTSRFEATSNSVLGAMAAGVPMAVSSYIGAEMGFKDNGAALVLNPEPKIAAQQLREALKDKAGCATRAALARQLAEADYNPAITTAAMIDMYRGFPRGTPSCAVGTAVPDLAGDGGGHRPASPVETRYVPYVAQVTPQSRPSLGGVQTHVEEVARRMTGLGIATVVISTDATGRLPHREVLDGISVERWKAWPKGLDWYLSPGVFWSVARGRFDLVHCQGVHSLVAPCAMAAALLSRKPYVITFHTGGHSSSWRRSVRRFQWRALGPLLRRAAALIAVCQYEVDLFSKILDIPPERFWLVRNGAELASPPPGHTALYPDADPVIVSVGRLERYKGHHRVVHAIPALRAHHPKVRLVIVGSGPYEAGLRKLVATLGVEEAVDFECYGSEQRGELAALLGRADALALLSEYEAHPVVVMEALSVGTPVVVADTSGLRELAEMGLATRVPLAAGPDEVAAALSQASASVAPTVDLPTWGECAARLAEIYRDVLLRQQCVH